MVHTGRRDMLLLWLKVPWFLADRNNGRA